MYAAAAGAVLQLGGAIFGAQNAKRRASKLNELANTPGLDTTKIAGEAITGAQANLPEAQALAHSGNTFNQDELDAIMEKIVPGYQAMKQQRSENAQALLRGETPGGVGAVVRRAAAKAGRGGYADSPAAFNLTLRDLGIDALKAQQAGDQMSQQLISGTPRAQMVDPLAWAGLTPLQLTSLREGERIDTLNRKTAAIKAPTSTDVWAKYLTDTGGTAMGMGASGAFSSMGGGKGGSGSQPAADSGSYFDYLAGK